MQDDMHVLVGDDKNGLIFPEEVSTASFIALRNISKPTTNFEILI
jgi:hypothetical protein